MVVVVVVTTATASLWDTFSFSFPFCLSSLGRKKQAHDNRNSLVAHSLPHLSSIQGRIQRFEEELVNSTVSLTHSLKFYPPVSFSFSFFSLLSAQFFHPTATAALICNCPEGPPRPDLGPKSRSGPLLLLLLLVRVFLFMQTILRSLLALQQNSLAAAVAALESLCQLLLHFHY